jgi:hypothetical protein
VEGARDVPRASPAARYGSCVRLELRFPALPVEAVRMALEPLGYRLDWAPETDGVGFVWRKLPLSGTGVRAAYYADGGRGGEDAALLLLETDGRASPTDDAVRDVTARLLAERFEGVRIRQAGTGLAAYGGGQPACPPAPRSDPPAWYT